MEEEGEEEDDHKKEYTVEKQVILENIYETFQKLPIESRNGIDIVVYIYIGKRTTTACRCNGLGYPLRHTAQRNDLLYTS